MIQIAPFFLASLKTFSNSARHLGLVFSRQQVGGTILEISFLRKSQYMEMLQQRAFLLPNMQFCSQWLWTTIGGAIFYNRRAEFLGVRVVWYRLSCFSWKICAREASLSLEDQVLTVVLDFLREERMRLLLCSISGLSSQNGRKWLLQLLMQGCMRSITSGIFNCDQTKLAFESWLVSAHQLRLRRMDRMRLLLLPLPMKQQYLLLAVLGLDLGSWSLGSLRWRQQWQELRMISRHQNILCNLQVYPLPSLPVTFPLTFLFTQHPSKLCNFKVCMNSPYPLLSSLLFTNECFIYIFLLLFLASLPGCPDANFSLRISLFRGISNRLICVILSPKSSTLAYLSFFLPLSLLLTTFFNFSIISRLIQDACSCPAFFAVITYACRLMLAESTRVVSNYV